MRVHHEMSDSPPTSGRSSSFKLHRSMFLPPDSDLLGLLTHSHYDLMELWVIFDAVCILFACDSGYALDIICILFACAMSGCAANAIDTIAFCVSKVMLGKRISRDEETIEQLRRDLETSRNDAELDRIEIGELRMSLEELDGLLGLLQARKPKAFQEKQRHHELRGENDKLRSEIGELRRAVRKSERVATSLRHKLEESNAEMAKLGIENDNNAHELENTRGESKKAHARADKVRDEMRALKVRMHSELKTSNARGDSYHQLVTSLERSLYDAKCENASMQTLYKECVDSLERQLHQQTSQNVGFQTQAKMSHVRVVSLQSQLQAVKSENVSLQMQARMALDALSDAEESCAHESEHTLCVVCLEENKNTLLMPCNHLCMCSNCAAGVGTCPMCRETVETHVAVFM